MVYNDEEVEILREGGRRLAGILEELSKKVVPGISTKEIDKLAEKLARKSGDTPAFLRYQPVGAPRPFPASVCISVNDEVVHGIPTEKPRALKEGDVVTIDMGLVHRELITDAAVTVVAGKTDDRGRALVEAAKAALAIGVKTAKAGNTVGDIGHAVEEEVKKRGFSVVRELGGHGVGHEVHEDPFVPNFGRPGSGTRLLPGMVLALEPIVTEGSGEVLMEKDGYTYKTADGSRCAQFEHTVFVTDGGSEVLTRRS